MSVIKKLDQVLANKIAAGEVIESLANVVKELVENSIDAKSTQIDIELQESGLKSIQVTDNGQGMDETDAVLAFERHATSKIETVNDLFRIGSLGFRGEALPSIAAVSRVELVSTQTNSSIEVVFEDGHLIHQKPASGNQGTKISVTKLFYTTPARFKYLKSAQYELASIINLIHRYALAYPHISFRLTNDDKLQFVSPGEKSLVDLMANIYSKDIARSLIPFSGTSRDYDIHGMVSSPIINRSSNRYIHLFVNQRAIQDPRIIYAIRECYEQLIPKNRYPIAVLYIECDPSIIDVNIHPRKQEVKFSEYNLLLELIKNTITPLVNQIQIKQTPIETNITQKQFEFHEPIKQYQEKLDLETEETIGPETKVQIIHKENPKIPDLEYIGQYTGTYLLFQNETGLYLVDQHAAAERIRYERYLDQMNHRHQETQDLLVPMELTLDPESRILIEKHLDRLIDFGLIGKIHANSLLLERIPSWFYPGYELQYAEEVVQTFVKEQNLEKTAVVDDLAKSLACKHSLKANHYITETESQRLLQDLRQCKRPFTCPHGRPIIVELSIDKIEHWFNRVI
ncbi:MAG: DNA mismatch repair endonuclease MutL [Bacilli bacterium]|nr:DNA mismatch repair endonuclease MutL [Bacilli bacterium]MBN2877417.1 DNA mismatch repair endonuclease MutL [Bacilli bacterium]